MANVISRSAWRDLLNGSIDLDTGTIETMLVASGQVPMRRFTPSAW